MDAGACRQASRQCSWPSDDQSARLGPLSFCSRYYQAAGRVGGLYDEMSNVTYSTVP